MEKYTKWAVGLNAAFYLTILICGIFLIGHFISVLRPTTSAPATTDTSTTRGNGE
ncbi:MAG: hypothetical protein ABSG31_10880 [Tepidisphaeraceae bacterium]|jgi:hypothetical protein